MYGYSKIIPRELPKFGIGTKPGISSMIFSSFETWCRNLHTRINIDPYEYNHVPS